MGIDSSFRVSCVPSLNYHFINQIECNTGYRGLVIIIILSDTGHEPKNIMFVVAN